MAWAANGGMLTMCPAQLDIFPSLSLIPYNPPRRVHYSLFIDEELQQA